MPTVPVHKAKEPPEEAPLKSRQQFLLRLWLSSFVCRGFTPARQQKLPHVVRPCSILRVDKVSWSVEPLPFVGRMSNVALRIHHMRGGNASQAELAFSSPARDFIFRAPSRARAFVSRQPRAMKRSRSRRGAHTCAAAEHVQSCQASVHCRDSIRGAMGFRGTIESAISCRHSSLRGRWRARIQLAPR